MKTTIVAAALTFAVAAAAFAPVAAAGPEEDFLDLLAARGIAWPSATSAEVVDSGYAVCTGWTDGVDAHDAVRRITAATGWTSDQAGLFLDAATGAFCPEYAYLTGGPAR